MNFSKRVVPLVFLVPILAGCGTSGTPGGTETQTPTPTASVPTITPSTAPTRPPRTTNPPPPPAPTETEEEAPSEPNADSVPEEGVDYIYYKNCAAARAAGAAPLDDDDPGYREGLDRDKDGVACES